MSHQRRVSIPREIIAAPKVVAGFCVVPVFDVVRECRTNFSGTWNQLGFSGLFSLAFATCGCVYACELVRVLFVRGAVLRVWRGVFLERVDTGAGPGSRNSFLEHRAGVVAHLSSGMQLGDIVVALCVFRGTLSRRTFARPHVLELAQPAPMDRRFFRTGVSKW